MATAGSRAADLARTAARLRWYQIGLKEAKPGYRGMVFSLPPEGRARVAGRAHAAMRSIRNKGARGGRGVDRTLSRLGWYMDGLRDAVPGYRGQVFALPPAERDARISRINAVLKKIESG